MTQNPADVAGGEKMTTYEDFGKVNKTFRGFTCPKCNSRKTKAEWVTGDQVGEVWVQILCAKCKYSIYYNGA
jgi:transcription elongation factor Elf1